MKVAWKGDPETREPATRAYGLIFPEKEARDISALGSAEQGKLVRNPAFEPADDEARDLLVNSIPVRAKKVQTPSVSEYADVWNRVLVLEDDVRLLKEHIAGEPADADEREELAAQIHQLTGKRPHPASKIETLRRQLEEATSPAPPAA